MALALSLKRGEDFYVGSRKVVMTDILPGDEEVVLITDVNAFTICRRKWTDLWQGVRVTISNGGVTGAKVKKARLLIEAPAFKVVRGSIYRNARKETHHEQA